MSDNVTPEPSAAAEPVQPQAPSPAVSLDLSVLKSLSFGPDWTSTPSPETLARKMGGRGMGKPGDRNGPPRGRDGGGGGDFGGAGRRDRRPTRAPGTSAPMGESAPGNGARAFAPGPGQDRPQFGGRPQGGSSPGFRRDEGGYGHGRGDRRSTPPPFQPTHEVLFYPDDAAFRALTKAIRASCRTFELFEVAHLILQKPERFVIVIKPYPRRDDTAALIHIAQPDHLPFDSEEEAVAHVFEKHLDKFCIIEEVEVEPPKGNFVGVSKCGFTGVLLGPPNYHRYPQMLREHHARQLSRMPFEKFSSRIELAKEPEQIAAWLEKMKKATRYKLKEAMVGAPEFFENVDAVRQFLMQHKKDAIVRAMDTARYPGRMIEQFPQGDIRYSVEGMLDQQRRFPLDTANNLRGRLRRMKFNLYKKGTKGVSYICAVKRRFRDPQTVLADHVQKLITFLEQHPLTPISKLAHEFLGLPLPPTPAVVENAAKPASVPVAPSETAAAVPEPQAVVVAEPQPGPSETTDTTATVEAQPEEAPAPVASVEASTAAPAAPLSPIPAAPEIPAAPVSHLSPEQQLQLRELVMNVRWLVTEGYVVEYGDGRLFAPPPLPAAKPKVPGENGAAATAETVTDEEHVIEDTAHSEETHDGEESSEMASTFSVPEQEIPTGPAADSADGVTSGADHDSTFGVPENLPPPADPAPPSAP